MYQCILSYEKELLEDIYIYTVHDHSAQLFERYRKENHRRKRRKKEDC